MEESFKPLILVYWPTPWGSRGSKDCPVLRAYKKFILRMVNYNGGLDTLTEIKFGVFNFLPLGSQPEFCRSKISLTHPWLYPPHLPEAQDDCFGKLSNFIFPMISVLPIVPQRCFFPTYNHCSSWDQSNPPWRSLTGSTIQCRRWRHYFPIKIMEQLQPALQHYKNL